MRPATDRILATVDRAYGYRPTRAAYRRYAASLPRRALATLGRMPREGEAADVAVARARLIEVLGAFGDDEMLADARATMANGAGTPGARRTAQTIVGAKADAATFDAMLAQARASDDPLQKLPLYQMLAGVEDNTLARRMVPIMLGKALRPVASYHAGGTSVDRRKAVHRGGRAALSFAAIASISARVARVFTTAGVFGSTWTWRWHTSCRLALCCCTE